MEQDNASPGQSEKPIDALAQQALLYLHPVLQTLLNGVMVSSQGWCPADKMLITLCGAFGTIVGNATAGGGLPAALQLRRMCLDAFTQGMRSVVPQPPPPPPGKVDMRAALNGTSGLTHPIRR